MKTKRILAMTIACALLTGSVYAAPLPQPDPDDPALGNFTITDESEGGQAKYSFTKAAEMVTAAREKAKKAEVGDESKAAGADVNSDVKAAKDTSAKAADPKAEKESAAVKADMAKADADAQAGKTESDVKVDAKAAKDTSDKSAKADAKKADAESANAVPAKEEKKVDRNRAGERIRYESDRLIDFEDADNVYMKWDESQKKSDKAKLLGKTGQDEDEMITLRGQIVGYETCTRESTLALVELPDGTVQRVQLGKRGGRLLKLTPFDLKGVMKTDENGAYLDVKAVRYDDPDPFGEYYDMNERLAKAKAAAQKKGVEFKRDAAYSHTNITSDDPTTLMQHNKVVSREDYTPSTSYGLKELDPGTKVALTGRCVMTVSTEDDIMEFWDVNMKRTNLRMNGVYVPLGQRCTILGVLNDDGTVTVDAMVSVAV